FLKEQEVERVHSKVRRKEAIGSYQALLVETIKGFLKEQESERVCLKVRRKEAIMSYQALLVETIKHLKISWTDAKPKLEKDPQGREANPHFDQSDMDKLFREHIKSLYDISGFLKEQEVVGVRLKVRRKEAIRPYQALLCAYEYKAFLADVITTDAAIKEYEDGKTVLNSWSIAKRLLKDDVRYNKIRQKDGESLW
ncbi:pre-mRNA-processing protein 40C, partial [Tanacetum coccineum]